MTKVLFICGELNLKTMTGGELGTKNNFSILISVFGKENVKIFEVNSQPNFIQKKTNWLKNGHINASSQKIRNIDPNLKGISLVFIDNSYLGNIAKYIKQKHPHIFIVSFFQNVEQDFARAAFHNKNKLTRFFIYTGVDRNERNSCLYSDKIIVLNQRDNQRIEMLYGRSADLIMPINMPDICPETTNATSLPPSNTAVFVGSFFFANINGIQWFIDNVLDVVNIKLLIVGRRMEQLPLLIHRHPQITILSDVPDLSEIYQEADFVVSPIFEGSGMKVKTCEALMYGKTIIGTKEAFEGYNLSQSVAIECNTANEFISAIQKYLNKEDRSKANNEARTAFLEKYAQDIHINKLRTFLQEKLPSL